MKEINLLKNIAIGTGLDIKKSLKNLTETQYGKLMLMMNGFLSAGFASMNIIAGASPELVITRNLLRGFTLAKGMSDFNHGQGFIGKGVGDISGFWLDFGAMLGTSITAELIGTQLGLDPILSASAGRGLYQLAYHIKNGINNRPKDYQYETAKEMG